MHLVRSCPGPFFFLHLCRVLTLNDAFYELTNALEPLYGQREAASISHEWLLYVTGLSKFERLLEKNRLLTNEQQRQYEAGKQKLLANHPLQYVTGQAWFMGKEFTVNNSVLIPRPETEELVQWLMTNEHNRHVASVLDVGTGSGCIAVMVKLLAPHFDVTAVDVSEPALDIADLNARKHGAQLTFIDTDFLDDKCREQLGRYDIIVSNPPYIPIEKKSQLDMNVVDHEPLIALFPPGDNALIFYETIATFGKNKLLPGGAIYCEVEATQATATENTFVLQGYQTLLQRDMHDNFRMLKAWLPNRYIHGRYSIS